MYLGKKKESPNSRSKKWTSLTLNDENLVFINRNFSIIRQRNKPFIVIVIHDDASDYYLLSKKRNLNPGSSCQASLSLRLLMYIHEPLNLKTKPTIICFKFTKPYYI